MSAAELQKLIGRKAVYTFAPNFRTPAIALHVDVKIVDAREAFGRVDVQVKPLKGCGAVWVQLDSVKVKK